MPYPRNSALPSSVRNAMPAECQTCFRHAFNSSMGNGSSHGRALVAGYAAVRRAGWKKGKGESRFHKRLRLVEKGGQREVVAKQLRLEVIGKGPKRVFYAWASVVEKGGELVTDWDGDGWPAEDMEKAAWRYASGPGQHGVNHESLAGSDLVASMPFTADLQKALGIDLGKVGWLVGYHVNDDALWGQIEKGELPMLSVHGYGVREPVAA